MGFDLQTIYFRRVVHFGPTNFNHAKVLEFRFTGFYFSLLYSGRLEGGTVVTTQIQTYEGFMRGSISILNARHAFQNALGHNVK